jgi:hypothetical protein
MVPPWAPPFALGDAEAGWPSRAGELPFGGGIARLLGGDVSFGSAALTERVGGRGLRPGPRLL